MCRYFLPFAKWILTFGLLCGWQAGLIMAQQQGQGLAWGDLTGEANLRSSLTNLPETQLRLGAGYLPTKWWATGLSGNLHYQPDERLPDGTTYWELRFGAAWWNRFYLSSQPSGRWFISSQVSPQYVQAAWLLSQGQGTRGGGPRWFIYLGGGLGSSFQLGEKLWLDLVLDYRYPVYEQRSRETLVELNLRVGVSGIFFSKNEGS
jgi:hypothetical protein